MAAVEPTNSSEVETCKHFLQVHVGTALLVNYLRHLPEVLTERLPCGSLPLSFR